MRDFAQVAWFAIRALVVATFLIIGVLSALIVGFLIGFGWWLLIFPVLAVLGGLALLVWLGMVANGY